MIIFLDVNFDDVITLMALISKKVHIDCIIVTSGWCHVGIGVANLLDILDWIGCKIPVFAGSLTTPNQESVFPRSLYFIDTLWNTMKYVPRGNHCLPSSGTEYIDFCKTIKGPVDVLSLISFTDVIPILGVVNIRNIYALGSDLNPGPMPKTPSLTKHSQGEFNIYIDPKAAAEALRKAGGKIQWLPIEYLGAIPVDNKLRSDIKRKYEKNKSNLNLFTYKLISHIIKSDYNPDISVADGILAILMLCPKYFTLEKKRLSMDDNMSRIIHRTSSTVTITEKYSTKLGLFLEDPNGTITNIVNSMEADKVYNTFINMF